MLETVAAWELDSALESPERTLLRTAAIARVKAGDATLVVGPRGAGKTAASRLILADGDAAHPTARIAMKDALLAALRPLAAQSARENASASARYLLLLAAFEAMVEEHVLRGAEIRDLAREFAVTLTPPLEEALPLAFNKTLLQEVSAGGRRGPGAQGHVADRIVALEHAMANALAGRRALVLLDEADDRTIVAGDLDDLRVEAVKVLLAGVRDLARGSSGRAITPAIFIRPDLFDRLPGHDRAQWRARRLDLAWTSRELRAVAGYRLARAADPAAPAKRSRAALDAFFQDAAPQGLEPAGAGGGAAWRFIWPRTRARPRDVVFFIRAAARNARHRDLDHVDARALAQAEKTFSAFLLKDMADEMRDVAPDVDAVFDAVARHGRPVMSAQEFVDVIERALAEAGSAEGVAGARGAIERLYAVSAIGNLAGQGRSARFLFAHDDPRAGLDYGAPVAIHPGLAAALSLEPDPVA